MLEGPLGDHALLDPGHVRGRDVDQVRRLVLGNGPVEVLRAEEVRLEGLLDRRVEADGGGRMDRDVDPGWELRLAAREVAVDHGDPLVQEGQELVVATEPLAEDIERRLAGQVVDALEGGRRGLRTDEDRDGRFREVEEEPLEDHLPEETGDPREEDALAREGVDDAGPGGSALYHAADYRLSTAR